MDPAVRRAILVGIVAVAAAASLIGGYSGMSWYLERTPSSDRAEPVRHTVAAAVPTPQIVMPRGRLVIHGTGDVNLDPTELGVARTSFAAPWNGVRGLFTSDDLTVVNLECSPGSGGDAQDKQFTFRCDHGHAEMHAAGVEVANMGNNHSGDFGPHALVDGRAKLTAAGIAPVGAGRDAREANTPAIFDIKGWKIAVLGFGGVVPSPGWIAGAKHPGVANGYDTASMVRAVRAADKVADLVIVAIHWGQELDTTPRADDVARAHALIDAGADAIFGHHAHRVQPLEFYKGRPIAYGLGNFVWPNGPSVIAEVIVSPDGTSGKACLLPATTGGGTPHVTGASHCAD
jgi:poly-gamma-glutamate synthesis protein (capsule biosynthesis protein)